LDEEEEFLFSSDSDTNNNQDATTLNQTKNGGGRTLASLDDQGSQLTYRSKSFNENGDEILSEDSYLFQWKPDYITR
jgi:hypothetical protein